MENLKRPEVLFSLAAVGAVTVGGLYLLRRDAIQQTDIDQMKEVLKTLSQRLTDSLTGTAATDLVANVEKLNETMLLLNRSISVHQEDIEKIRSAVKQCAEASSLTVDVEPIRQRRSRRRGGYESEESDGSRSPRRHERRDSRRY